MNKKIHHILAIVVVVIVGPSNLRIIFLDLDGPSKP